MKEYNALDYIKTIHDYRIAYIVACITFYNYTIIPIDNVFNKAYMPSIIIQAVTKIW